MKQGKHKSKNCLFKGICLDNNYEPPYCNECIEEKNNKTKREK